MPHHPDQGRRVPDPAAALLTYAELLEILRQRHGDKYPSTDDQYSAAVIHKAQREKFRLAMRTGRK